MGEATKAGEVKPLEEPHEEIITTHVNADFDALSSMIAAKKLYPQATLAFPGSQEKNLRNFFLYSTSYLFNFTKIKQIDFPSVKRLILVDTRQKSRIGKFADLVDREGVEIHIYDHHHDSDEDIHGDLEVIREVGSTTAILTDILRERGIPVTPDEATIMCLGIHEDTGSFTFSSTRPEDHLAAAWLNQQGANLNLIGDMLTRELSSEQIWLLSDLTKSAVTLTVNGVDVVLAKVIREEYVGDFAVLVHKFMEMENLNVIFALAQMEDKIYLVARSRLDDVNVAEIALAFGGGGHPNAASATIKNRTLIQAEKTLRNLLRDRIIPQKKAGDMMSSPVIRVHPNQMVKEAALLMTKYNINVLLAIDEDENLNGYVTRQVVEKAVYFGLGELPVREYTNIEFSTVTSEASLKEVQDLIIQNKLRILPVVERDRVVGVITRTDLLNILVGGPVIPDFLYESSHASHFLRKKNLGPMLKERLPRKLTRLFMDLGVEADSLGYNAYLVGGFVRDLFLKRENLDVDVVVEGDGIRFAQDFAKRHGLKVRSHQKFGTAVLIFPDGFKVDVATARIEYYESPAAPPSVEESSLKMDLYRRDFTMNTLAIKLNKRDYGALVDHFGALKDVREKTIRVLHNLSFVEDPTRVFRAIRFEQRFGFKIGKLTLALMKNAVRIDCFKDLSGRRLFLELKLLLSEEDPSRSIERLHEFDLLKVLSPGIRLTPDLRALLREIKEILSWFNHLYLDESYEAWRVYWHGLTSMLDLKALERLAGRLQMGTTEQKAFVNQRTAVGMALDRLHRFQGEDNHTLYTLLSQYDTEILLYTMARSNSKTVKRLISHYFTKLKGTVRLLRGRDLKALGLKPGPIFKEVLENLLEARLNGVVSTREDEIRFVRERFGSYLPAGL
ncbi:MAG: CBS domain-containing protein [Deltaproteobacteria bacterium]|nr:CBS domain-containing protein [Deltaproteobacteria bacterium]